MESVHCVVIGAGAVGLACARAMAMAGREVLILEWENTIGTGISARNSEVIHAGLYYPPASLKAVLCVRGRAMLYRYCAEHGIPHARTGKLVVATKPGQVAALETLHACAQNNGVADLRRLSRADVRALEPELDSQAALLSPSTGIVDSHGLMLGLLADAQCHGAVLACHNAVIGGAIAGVGSGRGVMLDIVGSKGETLRLNARCVINAAGLDAPAVARSMRGMPHSAVPGNWFVRGVYFSYTGKVPFSRLVYPLPEEGGLGVHLTLDLAGYGKFGPDVEWIETPDYSVDPAGADSFYHAIRQWWPGVERARLVPAYAGVRPKLAGPGMANGDFRIDGPATHGVSGLVNLFGIESPGLTACLAIGEHVASLV